MDDFGGAFAATRVGIGGASAVEALSGATGGSRALGAEGFSEPPFGASPAPGASCAAGRLAASPPAKTAGASARVADAVAAGSGPPLASATAGVEKGPAAAAVGAVATTGDAGRAELGGGEGAGAAATAGWAGGAFADPLRDAGDLALGAGPVELESAAAVAAPASSLASPAASSWSKAVATAAWRARTLAEEGDAGLALGAAGARASDIGSRHATATPSCVNPPRLADQAIMPAGLRFYVARAAVSAVRRQKLPGVRRSQRRGPPRPCPRPAVRLASGRAQRDAQAPQGGGSAPGRSPDG